MAKLQIFVFVVALAQVYGNIAVVNLPGVLPVESSPSLPDLVTPPCVASVRALLEAILAKLPDIEQPRPLPIDPEIEEEKEEVEDEPPVPDVELETPCTACFEHINNLLTSAEKALALRKVAMALYRRR